MNSKYFFEKLSLHQEENFQRTISKINQRYEQRVALEFANWIVYTMKMTLGNQSKPFNIECRTSTRQHKEKLKFEESWRKEARML